MKRGERNLARLVEMVRDARRLLILPHDHPDPDALASGWVLRHILRNLTQVDVTLGYEGMVGRTENRAMVDLLRIPLTPLAQLNLESFDAVALVDTQPTVGNNPLPQGLVPSIVIDHHPPRRASRDAPFCDLRPDHGATATIIYDYLQSAGLPLQPRYATGLFYAIRSETQNLGREASGPDVRAFTALFPRVDNSIISRIEHAPISRHYLALLNGAFDRSRIYGDVSLTMLDRMPYPDVPAELADLLLRVDEVTWSLVGGIYQGQLYLSMRSQAHRANAAKLLAQIVGDWGRAGGHSTMAGGKIDLRGRRLDAGKVKRTLSHRAREVLSVSRERPRALIRPRTNAAGRPAEPKTANRKGAGRKTADRKDPNRESSDRKALNRKTPEPKRKGTP